MKFSVKLVFLVSDRVHKFPAILSMQLLITLRLDTNAFFIDSATDNAFSLYDVDDHALARPAVPAVMKFTIFVWPSLHTS